jgi:hypothetical protein
MSQEETHSWEFWGITQEDWEGGWRREFKDAVEAAFADAEIGKSYQIRTSVRKVSENAVHDYKVER